MLVWLSVLAITNVTLALAYNLLFFENLHPQELCLLNYIWLKIVTFVD